MKLILLSFFANVVSLLVNAISCDEQKVYHLKLVKNIADLPAMHTKDFYDIDEKNLVDLYPMEKLSDAEREIVCKDAVKKANEKAEKVTFRFVKDDEMNLTKAYLVEREDAQPFARPKVILASKCSTEPNLYVQIHDRRRKGIFALLVSVIFRENDVKSPITCAAEAMLYSEKFVDEILPMYWNQAEEAKKRLEDNTYNTDNFKEELRMAMCHRALDIEVFANRNMKFLMGANTTDVRRLYNLIGANPENPSADEVALAFRCPTLPAVYLEVREVTNDETFWVSVIVNKSELPRDFRDVKFTYKLKTVLSISETSSPAPTQRLPFYHILKLLLFPSMLSEIDPNRFVHRQRSRMCRQASLIIDPAEGRHLDYLENESVGKCEYFRVNIENGRSDEVQAFKCPTEPPIYLAVGEQGLRQSIWVYLEESEPTDIFPKLDIVGFKMKIVTNIIDVPMSTVPELIQTADVQKSVIDPDALSRGKRKQLCEKAVQAVSLMKIKYFPEVASEMSRYYKLETEFVERQTVESNILQAFKCATAPEILLHITEREGGGNVLWIIMRENETLPTMNFTGYQVKTFKEITVVEPENLSRELSKIRTEVSTIRIEGLGEERRLQMCHTALKIASKPNIEFLKNTRTGEKRYYAVHTEADDGETSKTIVPAFKCPTEPPLYLHIKNDKDKFTVWIMMEEVTRAFLVEELRYDSLVSTSDIIEVPPSELKKESRSSLKRSLIDLDNRLTEGERIQMCLTALKHIPGAYVFNFLDDQETGKKKYYAIDMDSRETRNRSAALRPIFVEAFQCPTKPPIFLHVDEDTDAFTVWVIHRTPVPLHIDDLEFKVKIATAIDEIPLTELTKLPPSSIEKMVVDTNALSERERQELCRNALDALQEMDVQFSNNIHAGMKKYYVVVVDSGLAEYPSAQVVVQAFKCPCVPPIYVHINNQERGDAYEAWVFLKPIPNLNSMSYRFKVVDSFDSVPSTELVSNRADSKEDIVSLDTNDFPKEYRYKLCEKAVAKISQGFATMSESQDAGRSQYYYYRLVGPHEHNIGENRRKKALAFKCPSVPEIFIEVRKLREKYIAWVFVKDVDLKEEGEENCYFVQFAKSVTLVDLSGTQAAAVSSTEVNTDAIKVGKRYHMCQEAIGQPDLVKMGIEFVGNSTEDEQYRKHFYAIELMSGERYNVQAFDCPTEPPVYLQIHCWKSKCHIVSVILEQKEPRHSMNISQAGLTVPKVPKVSKKLKELRDSENESIRSRISSDSDEELIQVRTARSNRSQQRRVRESRRSRTSRESSASSRNVRDPSVETVRSRGSAGSSVWGEYSDLGIGELPVKLPKPPKDVPSHDEDAHQSRATDSDASSGTSVEIPLPTNVKHIDSIKLATREQISTMPSARREKLMVDTDKEYTPKQRDRMCHAAAQHVQAVDKVEFVRGVKSGPSQFYIIHERPLVNRSGKQKIVRAFECPTEPPLYLKVRRRVVKGAQREYEEVIVTVLVKNRSFVTFELKLANRITKTAALTSERSNEYDSDDERVSSAKRLHLCSRVFKIAKKVLKGPYEFSNMSAVPDVQSYVLNLATEGTERVRAFPCPCTPAVYLQVQPQIGYTKVSIIALASNESPFLEYPEDQSYEAQNSRIDPKKIRYKKKLVSDITQDDSPALDEEEDFVPDERDAICAEAIAVLFPKDEIILLEGYPAKSRKYTLRVDPDKRETVKAFPCPTVPPLYVQVQGNAASGYSASVIMEVQKRPPLVSRPAATPQSIEIPPPVTRPSSTPHSEIPPPVTRPSAAPRSVTVNDLRYTLVPVVKIQDASDMIRWMDVNDLPKKAPVSFTPEQRERICDDGLQALGPAGGFIEQLEKRPRDDYSYYLYHAQYTDKPGPIIEKVVNVFICKTAPKMYIEVVNDAKTKAVVANVLIERHFLPSEYW